MSANEDIAEFLRGVSDDYDAMIQRRNRDGDQPLTIADYKDAFRDHQRLVREIDVIINGENGAAKQASLCDLVGQIQMLVKGRSLFLFDEDTVMNSMPNHPVYGTAYVVKKSHWHEMERKLIARTAMKPRVAVEGVASDTTSEILF